MTSEVMEEQKIFESLPKEFADALLAKLISDFRTKKSSDKYALDERQGLPACILSLRREIEEKSMTDMSVIDESVTYSCVKCGSKLVIVIERVVRRADEGSIMEVNCSECHHKYNI